MNLRASKPLLTIVILGVIGGASGYLAYRSGWLPSEIAKRWILQEGAGRTMEEGPPGRWRRARPRPERLAGAVDEDEAARLFGLPYAAGTVPASGAAGVTVHDEQRALQGYNLLVSGHAASAILLDMQGRIVHSWSHDPESVGSTGTRRPRAAPFWRRARLLENGDLLAIYEGSALIRLDAGSNLLWMYKGECHHDLDVDERGSILVLERREAVLPRINPSVPVLADFVVTLTPAGEPIEELSLLECFERSAHAHVLDGMGSEGDLFHTNTLAILDGRLHTDDRTTIFKRGNLLISLRHLDTVAIVDPGAQKVVWAVKGLWSRQHDPVLLDSGRILVFDNLAEPQQSRIVELDPLTERILWTYEGSDLEPFYTESCGTNQRLANGNTLITESDQGRAFEITREGEIVWEFRSPYRAGDGGELVATLFEVTRLAPDFPLEWSKGPERRD